jgi:hypothetical protein
LQLFHTLGNPGNPPPPLDNAPPENYCINGREYLGNTPTVVAGPHTLMRFGVVGMGMDFHTFHLHGHRWVIPGPDGLDPTTIQNSVQKRAVSQFEDTKLLGPANSFVFTIKQDNGSFMGAPPGGGRISYALSYTRSYGAGGMMGSLLIVNGGEIFVELPSGDPMLSSTCLDITNNDNFIPT